MKLSAFISKGYFPKELPPPFQTNLFSSKLRWILASSSSYDKCPSESMAVRFSLKKSSLARRYLGIPHPKHFLELSRSLVGNWRLLLSICKLSPYAKSTPVESGAKRAIRTKSRTLNNFRFDLIEMSYLKTYELRVDISQFYASVYTHSITWAVMGKRDAKEYFRKSKRRGAWKSLLSGGPKAKLYQFCNDLDTLVRNCQDKQSVGIPVGPDSSFLLAELIGSRIDAEVQRQLDGIAGARYFDDYYFFVDSKGDAEKVLKVLQTTLSEFKLEINESKVTISHCPFSFEYSWANVLSSYRFRKIDKYELRTFFDIVIKLIQDSPAESSQIISYALLRFEYGNVPLVEQNFGLFVRMCLSILINDSSNLDQFLKILLSYKPLVTTEVKRTIGPALEEIIQKNAPLNHSFEASWALWILLSLGIPCKSQTLQFVLDSTDDVSRLIALDLISRRMFVGRRPRTSHLVSSMSSFELYGDHWLFAYEAAKKGWVQGLSVGYLHADPFIKRLAELDVEFYDVSRQIGTEFSYKAPGPLKLSGKKLTKKEKEDMLWAHALASAGSKY